MGAICGLITDQPEEDIRHLVNNMVNIMAFRGADYKGAFVKDTIGMGAAVHETIGDISQPLYNETNDIIAVCDGEIYNYGELKKELVSKGHILPKSSDTEVIPHLYEEFQNDFPKYINGIFSIALYDLKRNRLFLARDHLGSRSIFYHAKGGSFIFATTIKAMLHTGMIEREISKRAVDLYFASTCVPNPYTMLKKIKGVRPGHALIWEKGKLTEYEYWSLDNIEEDYDSSEAEFKEQIRELAIDAIKIRCHGNQPYASVLSGGVDSSFICSILSEFSQSTLDTFSIGYEEKGFDDSGLQKIMLEKHGFLNNISIMKADMAVELLLNVIKNCDYPLNNSSAMGTFLCMQNVCKAGFSKIFEGEAADELFCGGGGVVGEHLVQLFAGLPKPIRDMVFMFGGKGNLQIHKTGKLAALRRFCHRIGMPPIDRMLTWLPAFDSVTRKKLLTDGWNRYTGVQDELEHVRLNMKKANFKDGLNLYQYGACKTYLPNDLLFKNERMSSANGIVNRTPFIDYRLAELAFKIPAKYKLKGYTVQSAEKKLIYRKAIKGIIPDEILWRKKTRGFSQPTSLWMRKQMKEFVIDIMLGKKTAERGILNMNFVKQIIDDHMSGRENRDMFLWGIMTLELWMREFVDVC